MIATSLFLAFIAMMLVGVPIGVAMGLVGVVGFAAMISLDAAMSALGTSAGSVMTNFDMLIIPLFLLMGQFASLGGMSKALFKAAEAFLGHRRGGVAMAAIGACAGFGSICGSSLATAATMGQVGDYFGGLLNPVCSWVSMLALRGAWVRQSR